MAERRRNILLITSDQQHWNTLGCRNKGCRNTEVQTPHLDRLAAGGTMFERAYCPNPTCTPTRSSIITGLYPSQHGAHTLGTKLDERVPTVGAALGAAGYRTALVGKAHFQPLHGSADFPSLESYPLMQDLDYWRQFHGPFYGFDHVELARNHADEAHVGQHYAIWMEENGLANWRDYFRPPTGSNDRQRHRWELPERYHYGTWIAERSCAMLEHYAAADEPFLLWSSFFDPHPPYLVPEPWDTMYDPAAVTVPALVAGEHDANPPHHRLTQTVDPDFGPWRVSGQGIHGMTSHLHDRDELARDIACYYGMISLMDRQIGVILDRLDALGLAGDTLVVFSSDHGHLFGQHGLIAKGPFHYEDLIRVPLIVSQPDVVPAGRRSHELQSLVDLAPTFLRAAGVAAPAQMPMSGRDAWPVWTGAAGAPARDHVIVENRHEPDTIHLRTLVEDRYKLTIYYGRDYGELFDLQEDPAEVRNLWSEPGAAALKQQLIRRLLDAELGKELIAMPRTAGA